MPALDLLQHLSRKIGSQLAMKLIGARDQKLGTSTAVAGGQHRYHSLRLFRQHGLGRIRQMTRPLTSELENAATDIRYALADAIEIASRAGFNFVTHLVSLANAEVCGIIDGSRPATVSAPRALNLTAVEIDEAFRRERR